MQGTNLKYLSIAAIALSTAMATAASADEAPAAPYSLPWQLRPAAAGNALRSDNSFARYEDARADGGFTFVSTLLGSFKVPGTGHGWAGLAPLVRVALVNDSPPTPPGKYVAGGFAFVNPLVGATYATPLVSRLRAAFFLGVTIPVGMGGGNSPDAGASDARGAGQWARAQMDDSLFAVNDLALIPGVDLAWVADRLTIQAAVGPRFHIPLGSVVKIHPGVAYSKGLDQPMTSPRYEQIVQVDVPITF